jgi:hypothetical protein
MHCRGIYGKPQLHTFLPSMLSQFLKHVQVLATAGHTVFILRHV